MQQSVVMKQELRMNPRLYQAMDLLYMPMLDLQQHLKGELLSNPFLEMQEPDEEEERTTDKEKEKEKTDASEGKDETNWEEFILDGFNSPGSRAEFEQREYYEPTQVGTRDLADHLRDQLQLLDIPPRQLFLTDLFIGNIGEDGYLEKREPQIEVADTDLRERTILDDIVDAANQIVTEYKLNEGGNSGSDSDEPFTLEEAEECLRVMQTLDPPGVASRDLRECLILQLKELDEQDTLTFRLVDEAFDDLISHRWSELAKRYGLEPKDVQDAADGLARLDPKPGLRFASTGDTYVVPDLTVEKIEGIYRVFLNDGGVPRLRISKIYQEIAGDKKKFVGENRDFITEKLNSASWLIQAIEQRRQTMLKVMYFIVDRQRNFFEKGVEHLHPLTLREVADVIEMHESTVSRVTSQKYVQTPRGVFPLKFFFSSSLGTTTGEDASSRSVKALLEKLVGEEDLSSPMTDSAIVSALQERGVKIARRTVAKYRDQLGILPARMRKRV
jgi:RNA polymerase sigma-54 factor